jgi:hypothetical protein
VGIDTVGHGLSYGGGNVMSGTVNLYYIWYGDWADTDGAAPGILNDWGQNISSTPNYFVNTTYDDYRGQHVWASTRVAGNLWDLSSNGTSINGNDIWGVVYGALASGSFPVDPNGVYFVLTAPNIDTSALGMCTSICGWHSVAGFNGTNIKYSFIGSPSRCNGSCGSLGTTPNGDANADTMASIIFHELSETVSDPLFNGWRNVFPGYVSENGDQCAWNFGLTYTSGNGAPANAHVGNRDFLLQEIWVNSGGGYCGQAIAPPIGATGGPYDCRMLAGQVITDGQSLISCDGRFRLTMQYDGNLVLYQGGAALWASNTWHSTVTTEEPYAALMQSDGNFVIYNPDRNPVWASGTAGYPGAHLVLQGDGNLVIYDSSGVPRWASNTCCR